LSLRPSTICRYIWRGTSDFVRWVFYVMAMLCNFICEAINPATWRFPVRDRLFRQIYFTGVQAIPFTILVALFAGASIFLQCLFWLQNIGEMELLYRMVSALLIREAAPFMATFIIIFASASASTTELATMKITGQIDLLRAQGVDIFRFVAVPRILGFGIAALGLSIMFCAVAMVAAAIGFFALTDNMRGSFFSGVMNSVGMIDVFALVSKSFLPGLFAGIVCCFEGLRTSGDATEIPKAVSRAMLRAVTVGVFIWGAIVIAVYV
jgi:phospholipid/cholesterol/gamma-HCH transport system permease protein